MRLHGQKVYVQVLLDPHRAEMLRQHAEETGKPPSDLVRNLTYQGLKRLDPKAYSQAERRDTQERSKRIAASRKARVKKRDELARVAEEAGPEDVGVVH